MTNAPLSITGLFQARDAAAAKRRAEEEEAERQHKAELKSLAERAMNYQITDEDREKALARIKKAFMHGDKEVMITQFPSEICADSGRHINNHLEGWQETLPGVFKQVYEWWERDLKPGGFGFSARIIDYPGGMPGNVGLFITWPEAQF